MNRIFQKIPMLMVVLLGICSMSITAFAYYAYNYGVEVSAIQTAEYAVLVSIQNEGAETAESNLASYTFSGTEGDKGVTFSLTASGTDTAVGYCEIIFMDQSYYTSSIEVGESMTLVIKGTAGDIVSFVSHWGKLDAAESMVLISGESLGIEATDVTEAAEASEEATTEPMEESTEEAVTESTEATEESSSSEASESTATE